MCSLSVQCTMHYIICTLHTVHFAKKHSHGSKKKTGFWLPKGPSFDTSWGPNGPFLWLLVLFGGQTGTERARLETGEQRLFQLPEKGMGKVSRECWQVSRKCPCVTRKNFCVVFFFSVSAEGKKSNLTAIATWRGEVRQTHSHGHLGYSKHGQGNRVVEQMDGNRDKSGDQWMGIGYTAGNRCTTD